MALETNSTLSGTPTPKLLNQSWVGAHVRTGSYDIKLFFDFPRHLRGAFPQPDFWDHQIFS